MFYREAVTILSTRIIRLTNCEDNSYIFSTPYPRFSAPYTGSTYSVYSHQRLHPFSRHCICIYDSSKLERLSGSLYGSWKACIDYMLFTTFYGEVCSYGGETGSLPSFPTAVANPSFGLAAFYDCSISFIVFPSL